MSRPRYDWWGYIKAIIRRYPERLSEYRELHTPSFSIALTGLPGGKNSVSDPTMATALKEMPPRVQKEFNAVHKAVEDTLRSPNGQHKIKLVSLVFWKRSHTLAGAAMQIPCGVQTAKKWHGEFIKRVAKNLDLLD